MLLTCAFFVIVAVVIIIIIIITQANDFTAIMYTAIYIHNCAIGQNTRENGKKNSSTRSKM